MKQHSSEQEFLIHNLSQRVLGTQALFYPEDYGHSKEPADIAWVSNRCALLMYMTESKKPFETKRDHNLGQLNRWLKVWQNGGRLIGSVGDQIHQFSFDDVDHIVGLSIVDRGETLCEYHSDRVTYRSNSKLSVCATITGSVMREFVAMGAGPRDVIEWLNYIRLLPNQQISDQDLIEEIRKTVHDRKALMEYELSPIKRDDRFDANADRQTVAFLAYSKTLDDVISEIGADLKWTDVAWLGLANAALESLTAAPGETGHLVTTAVLETGIYKLEVTMAAGLKFLPKPQKDEFLSRLPGIEIVTALDFGRQLMMFVKARTGTSHIQQEIASIRAATFG